jgi:hypothetical protein
VQRRSQRRRRQDPRSCQVLDLGVGALRAPHLRPAHALLETGCPAAGSLDSLPELAAVRGTRGPAPSVATTRTRCPARSSTSAAVLLELRKPGRSIHSTTQHAPRPATSAAS